MKKCIILLLGLLISTVACSDKDDTARNNLQARRTLSRDTALFGRGAFGPSTDYPDRTSLLCIGDHCSSPDTSAQGSGGGGQAGPRSAGSGDSGGSAGGDGGNATASNSSGSNHVKTAGHQHGATVGRVMNEKSVCVYSSQPRKQPMQRVYVVEASDGSINTAEPAFWWVDITQKYAKNKNAVIGHLLDEKTGKTRFHFLSDGFIAKTKKIKFKKKATRKSVTLKTRKWDPTVFFETPELNNSHLIAATQSEDPLQDMYMLYRDEDVRRNVGFNLTADPDTLGVFSRNLSASPQSAGRHATFSLAHRLIQGQLRSQGITELEDSSNPTKWVLIAVGKRDDVYVYDGARLQMAGYASNGSGDGSGASTDGSIADSSDDGDDDGDSGDDDTAGMEVIPPPANTNANVQCSANASATANANGSGCCQGGTTVVNGVAQCGTAAQMYEDEVTVLLPNDTAAQVRVVNGEIVAIDSAPLK